MQIKQNTLGVIVGRFQVHRLHVEHMKLIQHVLNRHDNVLVILGASPLVNTRNNPLDVEARKQMILEVFPTVKVKYLQDQSEDKVWVQKIDALIAKEIDPQCSPAFEQFPLLYGGRDSFIKHYIPYGVHPAVELEPETIISGTELREGVGQRGAKGTQEFREGAVWASQKRFPTMFGAIDVAILRYRLLTKLEFQLTLREVYLGKKPGETKFRFIGGFLDPEKDTSVEDAVHREAREESGVEIRDIRFVGSAVVDDWRYRGEKDKIMSLFHVAEYASGTPQALDDIEEARWFDLTALTEADIIPTHASLLKMLKEHLDVA